MLTVEEEEEQGGTVAQGTGGCPGWRYWEESQDEGDAVVRPWHCIAKRRNALMHSKVFILTVSHKSQLFREKQEGEDKEERNEEEEETS